MCIDTHSTAWKSANLVAMRPDVANRIAELEAEVERLRECVQPMLRPDALDRLRAAASPVAVTPAEDRFYEAVEAGEVRT